MATERLSARYSGAGAMFTVVVAALAITIVVVAAVGPRATGRSLEDINPI